MFGEYFNPGGNEKKRDGLMGMRIESDPMGGYAIYIQTGRRFRTKEAAGVFEAIRHYFEGGHGDGPNSACPLCAEIENKTEMKKERRRWVRPI